MIVFTVLGWILTLIFSLLLVSMVLLNKWISVVILVLLILIVMPVTSNLLKQKMKFRLFPLVKTVVVILLIVSFSQTLIDRSAETIYADEQTAEKFRTMYSDKMKEWPVEYEDVYLDTEYGIVHVIKSGSSSLPPLVLLHASGVAGWSWKWNAEELSEHYQLFAVDTIGDAGLSSYNDINDILKTGEELADFYADIFDLLGIDSAAIVGASEGGFIATNIALYRPERVKKIVLAGPMGYSGAGKSVLRITLTQLFPLGFIQDGTEFWAFGADKKVRDDFGEWFTLLLSSTAPKKVPPLAFSSDQRKSISVPVLFIFGKRDSLVGNAEKAAELVQDIPDVEVEILDTAHLVAAEKPEAADSLIISYLTE